ncbi:hypothetical protein NDU88_005015 [Pleurodeles waltl]|uniref:Uncharacterized protein n=1 Tax=Pleurodeles waltl TaxID=8319 RepID=A0AAV7VJU8_PLEWA|nr:hypothetical protein NDU88_005015 [Pleurodeles waltl]
MGKSKAVDLPESRLDCKKQKKRSIKPTSKPKSGGLKPFEEIDHLFEEVEAILNFTVGTKKVPAQPKRIQDFFCEKNKDTVLELNPPPNGASVPSNALRSTPPPFCEAKDAMEDCIPNLSLLQTEEGISLPLAPIPLSPLINVLPNIPCSNRFQPLFEEVTIPRTHVSLIEAPDARIHNSPPILTTKPQLVQPSLESNMSLILLRVDELKSMVQRLTLSRLLILKRHHAGNQFRKYRKDSNCASHNEQIQRVRIPGGPESARLQSLTRAIYDDNLCKRR